MKRIDTMSIRDILRHHHDLGLPRAEIAVAVSVSAGTVSNVLERAQAAGLSHGRCRPISTMTGCARGCIRRRRERARVCAAGLG